MHFALLYVSDILQTELLLDRLVLICSRVIIRHCNVYNAASLAAEASFYLATTLKLSVFDYIISSMETMLESGLLDDMDVDVLQDLCSVIAQKQSAKLPISRGQVLLIQAMDKHRDWLALQDIPVPRVRVHRRWKPRSPVISPAETFTPAKTVARASPSPWLSPELKPFTATSVVDDIFTMDDEPTPPMTAESSRSSRPMTPLDLSTGVSSSRGPVWKSRAVEAERYVKTAIRADK
jgi:hypothetical protein